MRNSIPCVFFHGDQTQKDRIKAMSKMRRLRIKVILTTDLLARGVDLPKVNIVINFDASSNQNQYLHRIGRTGRFGVNGVAISFLNEGSTENGYLTKRVKNGILNKLSLTEEGDISILQNEINTAIIGPEAVKKAYQTQGAEVEDSDDEATSQQADNETDEINDIKQNENSEQNQDKQLKTSTASKLSNNEDQIKKPHDKFIPKYCGQKRTKNESDSSTVDDKSINKDIQIVLANKRYFIVSILSKSYTHP